VSVVKKIAVNYNFNYYGVMVTRLTTFLFLYCCITASS